MVYVLLNGLLLFVSIIGLIAAVFLPLGVCGYLCERYDIRNDWVLLASFMLSVLCGCLFLSALR